ncbi:hypothetical protein L7F22_054256 [Adiantum nelumboides]|nr:hypothetical protein [Adiantum nelumboides]
MAYQRAGSLQKLVKGQLFVAGTLPFARARACLEKSPPTPLNTTPACNVSGTPAIIQHVVLNDKRHVLTKDAAGVVKLWEITKGAVIDGFGKVPFEDKEKELFEMVSIPSWFAIDTRLGIISVHLETPQCFSAEMYAVDLQVSGASEEQKPDLHPPDNATAFQKEHHNVPVSQCGPSFLMWKLLLP